VGVRGSEKYHEIIVGVGIAVYGL